MLNDFLRGKVPWYTPLPEGVSGDGQGIEGRKGVLGEMGKVEIPASSDDVKVRGDISDMHPEPDDEAFEGFEDDIDDESGSENESSGGSGGGVELSFDEEESPRDITNNPRHDVMIEA